MNKVENEETWQKNENYSRPSIISLAVSLGPLRLRDIVIIIRSNSASEYQARTINSLLNPLALNDIIDQASLSNIFGLFPRKFNILFSNMK